MNRINILFLAALAITSFGACTHEEPDNDGTEKHDDAYWVALATVSSSDSGFTSNGEGGTIRFGAEGGEVTVNVDCGTDWVVDNTASDLFSAVISSGILTVTAGQSYVEAERTGTLTLRTSAQRITFATITVVQSAYKEPGAGISLSLSCETASLCSFEDSCTITVESNTDWDLSYDSSVTWCAVERSGDDVTVSAEENLSDDTREVVLTFTATDAEGDTKEVQTTVVQKGIKTLILTYNTTAANTSVKLPVEGTVNCTVDWGDGSSESVTASHPSHTYEVAGEYKVMIDGTVTAIRNYNAGSLYSAYLTSVIQWGMTGLTSLENAFYNTTSLASVATDRDGSFSDVTTLKYAFTNCTGLKELPSGLLDHCSKVTSLYGTFGQSGVRTVPEGLFDHCTAATTINRIFFGCTSLKTVPEELFAKCAELTDCYAAFYSSALQTVSAGMFKGLDKVSTFEFAFGYCDNLKTVESSAFAGCSGAEALCHLFESSGSLQTIAADIFEGCAGAKDCSWLFEECDLKEIPEGLFDDCISATSFDMAFAYCINLTSAPNGLFANCLAVESFSGVFFECSSLATVPSDLFATPDGESRTVLTSMDDVFYGCASLAQIPVGLFDSCSNVENFDFTFGYCEALAAIPAGLFSKCEKVLSFGRTFAYCSALTDIPEGLFDNCPEVTTFQWCFGECNALESIPAGLFAKCSNVTTFKNTFYANEALKKVPEGLFDACPEVENVSDVFLNCDNLKTVPESLFANNLKITDFENAFNSCSLKGESPYNELADGTKVHLYERAEYASELGCVVPESYDGCFLYCEKLTDYYQIPSSWGGGATGDGLSASSPDADSGALCVESERVKPARLALIILQEPNDN